MSRGSRVAAGRIGPRAGGRDREGSGRLPGRGSAAPEPVDRLGLAQQPAEPGDGSTAAGRAELVRRSAGRSHLVRTCRTRPPGLIDAVALAVDAAWARADARNTAERLEALDAAIRGITGVLALDRVLQLIVDRVRDLIAAEYAALGINNEHGMIERFVTSGITRAQREAIGALPHGRGLLGLIIAEDRAYRIPEIAVHSASHGFPPGHPPMQSFLGVPVRVKGHSVGNFYLTNK